MYTGAKLGQRVVLYLLLALASAVVHVVQSVRAVVVGRSVHLFKLYAILCNESKPSDAVIGVRFLYFLLGRLHSHYIVFCHRCMNTPETSGDVIG
jgi:hypothetical protein